MLDFKPLYVILGRDSGHYMVRIVLGKLYMNATCFKAKSRMVDYEMGNLPKDSKLHDLFRI